jgi:hypothetical protein
MNWKEMGFKSENWKEMGFKSEKEYIKFLDDKMKSLSDIIKQPEIMAVFKRLKDK